MRNSALLLAALAMVAAGEAVAQSTLNHVVVPPAAGVVIPSRGVGGPRLGAAPGGASAVIARTAPLPFATPPVVLPAMGVGLATPGIAALALPTIAAAVLGGTAAGARGGSSAPTRTR